MKVCEGVKTLQGIKAPQGGECLTPCYAIIEITQREWDILLLAIRSFAKTMQKPAKHPERYGVQQVVLKLAETASTVKSQMWRTDNNSLRFDTVYGRLLDSIDTELATTNGA